MAWDRREFLRLAALAAAGLAAGCAQVTPVRPSAKGLAVGDLPVGKAPPALPTPHFPSRLHAFVWRNWALVPAERMAAVVGARRADILALGQAMGLGTPPKITSGQRRRSVITVIKRNWHLLPYEQLLALLDCTPDELAFTLREDDFLYHKLGQLKPVCAPLRWAPPEAAARQRELEVARVVRETFGDTPAGGGDPLFGFVERLSRRPKGPAPVATEGLRFCYSYFALYGDPLLEPEADPYPDGYLARLAAAGVNGVWLQALLYKLAPFPWKPELSERHAERLQALGKLVARAKAHGIGVYLYLNEPRAMPLAFYEAHPELKGVVEGDHAALCTSVPAVRDYLSGAVASICRAVPDLGGFFTISGSENLTHCWSHHGGAKCPRCGARSPAEVVAEANGMLHAGIRQAGGRQRLIVWDWGWNDAWVEDIARLLPEGVALMSVSEWSLPIERGGVKTEVGEYCLSAVGPGPRARRHWAIAQKRGRPVLAKIQAANTWELSAVPYIPAVAQTARHAANLRELGVREIMLGWTLGGYPSPNLEVVAEVMRSQAGGAAEEVARSAMLAVARRRAGEACAPAVVRAWEAFSAAFREFPFNINVVYTAPLQNGPSNLLWTAPTGYAASMVGFPYDAARQWASPYPPEVFAAQLEKVADGFDQALAALRAECGLGPDMGAAGSAEDAGRQAVAAECAVAEVAALHWRSVACQVRFVLARDALAKVAAKDQAAPLVAELRRLLQMEIRLAQRLHARQAADSRFGFEASNQYYYIPLDLVEKVLNCRDLLDRWLPARERELGL